MGSQGLCKTKLAEIRPSGVDEGFKGARKRGQIALGTRMTPSANSWRHAGNRKPLFRADNGTRSMDQRFALGCVSVKPSVEGSSKDASLPGLLKVMLMLKPI